jgi:3',5'-cyclic-AMP phosphodiesterase
MQKVEGNVAFHTVCSTAFPQPAPGTAKGPGPMLVPAAELKQPLGIARVSLVSSNAPLAIVDTPLAN